MEEKLTHINSGIECEVAHLNEDGSFGPQCIQCSRCKEWIHPSNMNNECIIPDRTLIEQE